MTLYDQFKQITTLAFDLDGVLTDGTLTILPDGIMARKMNVKDGYALQLAVKKGYRVLIISGSVSEEVVQRLHRLGVKDVFMKVLDKADFLEKYLQANNLNWSEVLFMGDDIPDLDVMRKVGIPCCPADAVQEIKEVSQYISPLNGGYACGRDVIEKVMKLRGDWNDDTHVPST